MAVESDDLQAYFAIPSVDRVLRDLTAFAEIVQPGMVNEATLTSQIGAMIGDPGLSTVHRDRPIVVLVLKGTVPGTPLPPVAAIVPAKEGSPVEQIVSRMGMVTKRTGDELIVGQTSEALAAAESVQTIYDQITTGKFENTLRVYLHAGRLLDSYRPLIESQINALSGLAGMFGGGANAGNPSIATQVHGLIALLAQCRESELSIGLGKEGLTVDTRFTTEPGSSSAELFRRSGRGSAHPSAVVGDAPGFASLACSIDPEALAAFADDIVGRLAKDSDATAVKSELTGLWTELAEAWTGTARVSYGISNNTLSYSGALGVKDETKLLESVRTKLGLLKKSGPVQSLYKSLGMDLSVEVDEVTREHAGVSIRDWSMKWESGGLMEAAKGLDKMPGLLSLAVVDDLGLFSSTREGLDRMIDEAKSGGASGQSLEAARVFGKGHQVYLDFDYKALFEAAAQMGGDDARVAQVLAQAASGAAMLSVAASFEDNRMRVQTRVPSGLIKIFSMLGIASRSVRPTPVPVPTPAGQ